jgi:hypothetical protein
MLYWVSVACYKTGEFLGVAIINRPSASEAADVAVVMSRNPHICEACTTPIPAGEAIPAEAIGRLLCEPEIKRLFPESLPVALDHVEDAPGDVEREPAAPPAEHLPRVQ